jgi:hypothetical protein
MTSTMRVGVDSPPRTTVLAPPRQALRLTLKPKAPVTGYVDGAWWPRSRDLAAELPPLLAVLATRLGPVHRVSYNITAWEAAPRRLEVGGRQVRLGGFHVQDAHAVDVIGPSGSRLTLLVVPPHTDQATAHHIMMAASRRDNVDGIEHLLTSANTADPRRAAGDFPCDTALERWELDGGARGGAPATL